MNKTEMICRFAAVLSAAALACGGCSDDAGGGGNYSLGEACGGDEECTDPMQCVAGKCSRQLRDGSACGTERDCLSQRCLDGVCVSRDYDPDKICRTHEQCKTGYCIGNVCNALAGAFCNTAADCGDGLSCRRSACVIEVAQGGACENNAAYYCLTGACEGGRCVLSEQYKDSDGDTIADIYEGRNFSDDDASVDTDGDTVPDYLDFDSDGDTIPDSVEAGTDGNPVFEPIDSDGDTVPDFRDADSDGNGLPDMYEGCPSAEFVYRGADSPKKDKNNPAHACLTPIDTDGDGVPDWRSRDNDGDGAPDEDEMQGILVGIGGVNVPGRHCGGQPCPPGSAADPWDSDGDTVPDYLDFDSDGDTIPDLYEGYADSDGDGILDRYSLDSDGDTIPDRDERGANGDLLVYVSPAGVKTYCFQSKDCDGDGIPDAQEPTCGGVSGINLPDTDGDGFMDPSEIAAGEYAAVNGLLDGRKITRADALVCDPNLTVKDVFDFYFELPYEGEEKDDTLEFIPKVSKLDLVFNIDTTASMSAAIANVKENIGNTTERVRAMVPNSGFALSNFDDYPVTSHKIDLTTPSGGTIPGFFIHGDSAYGDLPFRVLGKVSTSPETVKAYTQSSLFATRSGADGPESGIEALYHIATGKGTRWDGGSITGVAIRSIASDGSVTGTQGTFSWTAGSIADNVNEPGTWGGVDFRDGVLPVVVHATDVYAHDADGQHVQGLSELLKYNVGMSVIDNPHTTDDLIAALKQTGIRVMTFGVPSQDGTCYADRFGQMTAWSRESNAVVPACAFESKCGANRCCLGTTQSDPVTANGRENQCILYYTAEQNDVSEAITDGVAALVKYGTYEVSTRAEGEPIAGTDKTTACFIKRVEAEAYLPPPAEPERSCNPKAVPGKMDGADYDNGFSNFAPGTADPAKDGARLHFKVIAQNGDCVKPTEKAQIFKAYIDVINPTTGLVFGRRQVSIIVPAGNADVVN